MKKQKIVIGITGASGSIYAQKVIEKLKTLPAQIEQVNLVFSDCGKQVWKHEIGELDTSELGFSVFENSDFFAPFASGSSDFDCLLVCPCSMGALGRIANGFANDLISRTADVMLKERKKLILVCRETPYNLIHLENMKQLTLAGAVILPASPSFYSRPTSIDELVNTVVERILAHLGLESEHYSWNSGNKNGF